MSRRSSTRIPGDLINLDSSVELVRSTDSPGRGRKSEVSFGRDGAKRRKKEMMTMFKPQPIPSTSSDTPPEEETTWANIPPPPSERKIARRRLSIKQAAIRTESPISAPIVRRGSEEDLIQSLRSDDSLANGDHPSPQRVQTLSFGSTTRSPLPGHRPTSPPRQELGFVPLLEPAQEAGPSRLSDSMAPPTGYVRKSRKSLKNVGLGLPDQEKRIDSLLMPMPDSETPMIRKNQEMREAQRRSSLSMRGQRASTSLGKGELTIPHSSVDPSMFYRHISPLIPEPIRARHLIAWCVKRAGDSEVSARTRKKRSADQDQIHRTEDGDRVIAGVLDDFGLALGKNAVDTNIMPQSNAPPLSFLAPHPRNVANRQIQEREEAVIKRCTAELHLWDRLHKSAHSRAQNEHSELREKRRADMEPDIYASEDGWMRVAIKLADRVIREGEGSMKDRGDFADVEYKVDTLLQSTHSARQYSDQAQRFLDGIFEALTKDLRAHDSRGTSPSGPQNDTLSLLLSSARPGSSSGAEGASGGEGDMMNMLRALASMEGSNPDSEVLAEAEALESMPPTSMLVSSVGPGSKGWTPRRVTSGTTTRGPG